MSYSSYRLRNVLLAALLAILAIAITLVYVSRARTQGNDSRTSVPVLVAAHDIPIGTTGVQLAAHGWVRETTVARADLVPGALSSVAGIGRLVATQRVYAGEQILASRFGAETRQGLRSALHGSDRIVELPGDAHQLLAGTLRDGDRVDVVASIRRPEVGQTHFSRIVLRGLLVVQAPESSSGSSALSGAASGYSAQLELTTDEAQRLFWVEKNADWALALRPAGDAVEATAGAVGAATILEVGSGR